MTFSWATIRVRNLEDSLAFYHNLLGLPIHDRFGPPGHQIVMLGTDPGTKLELIESAEQTLTGIYASLKSNALYSGYLTLLPDIQADLEIGRASCRERV